MLIMGDDKRFEKLEEAVNKMTVKLDDIHKAMTGDEYGNRGYSHRIFRLETKQKASEKLKWTIAGGAAVISAIVGFLIKYL